MIAYFILMLIVFSLIVFAPIVITNYVQNDLAKEIEEKENKEREKQLQHRFEELLNDPNFDPLKELVGEQEPEKRKKQYYEENSNADIIRNRSGLELDLD